MPSYIFSGFLILITVAGIFFYGSADAWNEAFMAALILTGSRAGILSAFGEILFLFILPSHPRGDANEKRNNFTNAARLVLKKIVVASGLAIVFLLGVAWVGQDKVVRRFEKLPFYADPRLFSGNHPVKTGALEEGFGHLRAAFERRPAYFESVARFAWLRTSENPAETIRLLSPLSPEDKARVAEFLIDKDAAAFAGSLTCGDASALTAPDRERLVSRLFAKGYFYFARRMSGGLCESAASELSKVEDAGFENADVKAGSGLTSFSMVEPITERSNHSSPSQTFSIAL